MIPALTLTLAQTREGDAIEKYFCAPFEKLQKYQMSEELSHTMITLLFSKNNVVIPEDEKPHLMKIIEKRLKACFTFSILDIRLTLFLCVLCVNPGNATMYLTYLQYWAKYHQKKFITLDDFCEKIFPKGFPSDEDMHKLWLRIKITERDGGSDNLLDYQSAMRSIQFEEVKM